MKYSEGRGVRDKNYRGKNVVRIKFGTYSSEFQDFKAAASSNAPVAMARLVVTSCGSPVQVVGLGVGREGSKSPRFSSPQLFRTEASL